MALRKLANDAYLVGTLGTRDLTIYLRRLTDDVYASKLRNGSKLSFQEIQDAIGKGFTAIQPTRPDDDLNDILYLVYRNVRQVDDGTIRTLSTSKGLTSDQYNTILNKSLTRNDEIYKLSKKIFSGSADPREAASTTQKAYYKLLDSGKTEEEVKTILGNAKAADVTKIVNGDLAEEGIQALLGLA